MTDEFWEFMEYSYLDEKGHRHIKDDAPEDIKAKAREADRNYFERTGRHKMQVDD